MTDKTPILTIGDTGSAAFVGSKLDCTVFPKWAARRLAMLMVPEDVEATEKIHSWPLAPEDNQRGLVLRIIRDVPVVTGPDKTEYFSYLSLLFPFRDSPQASMQVPNDWAEEFEKHVERAFPAVDAFDKHFFFAPGIDGTCPDIIYVAADTVSENSRNLLNRLAPHGGSTDEAFDPYRRLWQGWRYPNKGNDGSAAEETMKKLQEAGYRQVHAHAVLR